jgi:hypothetical protein
MPSPHGRLSRVVDKAEEQSPWQPRTREPAKRNAKSGARPTRAFDASAKVRPAHRHDRASSTPAWERVDARVLGPVAPSGSVETARLRHHRQDIPAAMSPPEAAFRGRLSQAIQVVRATRMNVAAEHQQDRSRQERCRQYDWESHFHGWQHAPRLVAKLLWRTREGSPRACRPQTPPRVAGRIFSPGFYTHGH